ncbi:hypothetical protein PV11_01677 [Exophiala sideris]|uniref:Thiolase N-terminal domain-containing protein n=1 Tax=Exophiala sideris TaxID=1016849 RepID=A0A0D1XDN9_9EURO|nr:hypothetical protein PV11_01677 [Exophiala sideris]
MEVYIAGVGLSPAPSPGSSAKSDITSMVSAATKALLDAGVTFDDITRSVSGSTGNTPNHGLKVSQAFYEGDIPVDEVESGAELEKSFSRIKDQGAPCVLMTAIEKSSAVAFVLVSDDFLWSRPYLKDSAARLGQSDHPKSGSQETREFGSLCQTVWSLRGWTDTGGKAAKSAFSYQSSTTTFELSRADSKSIPEWKDVQYKQDGKHRLGYNPATEDREISYEDFEAVCAVRKRNSTQKDWNHFRRKGGDRAALARL